MQRNEPPNRIINHKVMRAIIGLIALQMPLTVLYLSGRQDLTSISICYWTHSRDIFVGSLIAVGFFLSAYNGTGKRRDLEYWLSKVACFFAICVAFFPTEGFSNEKDIPAKWILDFSKSIGQTPATIHNCAAILLFLCLFFLMLFFSCRAKEKGKLFRSKLYLGVSLCMLLGMPSVYFILNAFERNDPIFWVELLGLGLFGFGWIVAGFYHTEDSTADKDAAALPLTSLAETESIVVKVNPSVLHYPTGLIVEADEQYTFQAEGHWLDWFKSCGPNGWGPKRNPLAFFNRKRLKPFFLLCGNVGRDDDHAFCIGENYKWTVPPEVKDLEDRQLYLFANDWYCMYWNNKPLPKERGGPLKVTISRLNLDEE